MALEYVSMEAQVFLELFQIMSAATVTSFIQFAGGQEGGWEAMFQALVQTEEVIMTKLGVACHMEKLRGVWGGEPEAWGVLRRGQLTEAVAKAKTAVIKKDAGTIAETLHDVAKSFLFLDQAPAFCAGPKSFVFPDGCACKRAANVQLANGMQMIGETTGAFPYKNGEAMKAEFMLRLTVDGVYRSKMFSHQSWSQLMGFRVSPLILLENHDMPAVELYLLFLNYATYTDLHRAFGGSLPMISYNVGTSVLVTAQACDKFLVAEQFVLPAFEYQLDIDMTEETRALLTKMQERRAEDQVLCDDVPILELKSDDDWKAWVVTRFLPHTKTAKLSFKDCNELASLSPEVMLQKMTQMKSHLPEGVSIVMEWGGLLIDICGQVPSSEHVLFQGNAKMDKSKSVRLFDAAQKVFFGNSKVLAQSGYVSQYTCESPGSVVEDDAKTKLHQRWASAIGLEDASDWEGLAQKTAWGVGDHALAASTVAEMWQKKKCRGDFVPDPDYILMKMLEAQSIKKRQLEMDVTNHGRA